MVCRSLSYNLIWLYLLLSSFVAYAEDDPFFVRVRIDHSSDPVSIKSAGNIFIKGQDFIRVNYRGDIIIAPRKDYLLINNNPVNLDRFLITANEGLIYSGRSYSGYFEIIFKDGKVDIINHLELEDYVSSVVACEIGQDWPIESMKAQAVASRTYAAYHKNRSSSKDFDLAADTSSQVYRGKISNERILKAVKETKSEVVSLPTGEIVETLFHSSSAGKTENPSDIWQTADHLSHLSSRYVSDKNSPYNSWELTMKEKEIRDKLKSAGRNSLGMISYISTGEFTSSGRVKNLRIIHSLPVKITTIPATFFRDAVGNTKLRSTRFTVTKLTNGSFLFRGSGYGHGIGMSQYAAKNMAQEGKSYKEILRYFYKNTVISKLSETKQGRLALKID